MDELQNDSEYARTPDFRTEIFQPPSSSPVACFSPPSTFSDFFRMFYQLNMSYNPPLICWYVFRRKWNLQNCGRKSCEWRMITQVLSYPLTLSYLLYKISSQFSPSNPLLNITVVGARAESSLPILWWREMVHFALPSPLINILMVGPQTTNSKRQRVRHTFSASDTTQELIVRRRPSRALFHDRVDSNALQNDSHIFCLFNPGLGQLRESWEESMDAILKTRKPVILSAHSKMDLERDLKFLYDRYGSSSLQFLQDVIPNPFMSGRRTLNQFEEHLEVSTANELVYILKLIDL